MNRIYMMCLDGIMRTWRMDAFRKFVFKVRAGWFTLRGGRYHIDPEKYIKKSYFPWWNVLRIPFFERIELALAYREGETEPIKMFAERDDKATDAQAVESATQRAFLASLLPPPIPWVLIIVVLGMFIVLGLIGVLMQ